jgi:hypothetical protein
MSETEPMAAQPTPIAAQPAPMTAQPTPTQAEHSSTTPEPTDTQRQLAGHIADARRSLTPDSAAIGQVHATLAVAYAILVASESQARL